MKQQTQRRPRVVRATMLPVNVVGQEHRLYFFGFVFRSRKSPRLPVRNETSSAASLPCIPRNLFPTRSNSSNPPAPRNEGSGRCFRKNGCKYRPAASVAHPPAQKFPHRAEKVFEIPPRSARGPPTTAPPDHPGTERARIARHHPQSMPGKIQVSNHRRANMLAMYDVVEARQPGAISSVTQQPPTISRRSKTSVEIPPPCQIRRRR